MRAAYHHGNGQSVLLYWPCACRSFKPEKHAERLRGVGNSSGDENGSDSMKYWEIIAGSVTRRGVVLRHRRAFDQARISLLCGCARDGRRFIVKADDLL